VLLLRHEPMLSPAKTSIRPGNRHEWEAMIIMHQSGLYALRVAPESAACSRAAQ